MVTGAPVQIDGLELISRVSRGARAELWQARTRTGRLVAVKLFDSQLSQQPRFLTEFEKHSAALLSLSHPNVVPALDRGKSGSRFYLVSEWVHRGSVREQSADTLTAKRAVNIGLEVCEALDYAHRRGLLHRNLVLDNILVDERGTVRVSDFGLSLLNSSQYGSPYEARNDLHALAEVLYELVTGSRPPRTGAVAPGLTGQPERFKELLSRALSPDLSARFSRATEMALALRLATPRGDQASSERPEQKTMSFAVNGKLITITISPAADAVNVKRPLEELATTLQQPGPWRLAYDLESLSVLDDGVASQLRRVHTRFQRNIEAVGFSSPRALVRSSALVIGGAVRELPWKMFAASGPMHQWLERGVSP